MSVKDSPLSNAIEGFSLVPAVKVIMESFCALIAAQDVLLVPVETVTARLLSFNNLPLIKEAVATPESDMPEELILT